MFICPILRYDFFTNDKKAARGAMVYSLKFKEDIQILLDNGYTAISLLDIYEAKQNGKHLPAKPVCIVLIGGYDNYYHCAFPILKDLGVHADIFVATDLVGLSEYPDVSNFNPHFSWEEANEMQKSGLVDIYALWHPFDEGKNLETNISKKIGKIKANVKNSHPNIAFCISVDKDAEQKQIALDKNRIGLNLVHYWTFNKAYLSKRNIPYIGVNQESSVLDIIDCFYSKLYFESELYSEPKEMVLKKNNWKTKFETVILPIDKKPRIKNLLRNALPLSIIGASRKDRADLIVLNNFIEVVFHPWHHFFDYDNHMYLNWPELSCCSLNKDDNV